MQQYIKEAERIKNTESCRSLPNDPTRINNDTVNKTIKRLENEQLIKDKVEEGLITENPCPEFTKEEFLEDQSLFQLIVILQKHRKLLISTYNQ